MEVYDKEGKVRGLMATGTTGKPALLLEDEQGKPRAGMMLADGTARMSVLDKEDKAFAELDANRT